MSINAARCGRIPGPRWFQLDHVHTTPGEGRITPRVQDMAKTRRRWRRWGFGHEKAVQITFGDGTCPVLASSPPVKCVSLKHALRNIFCVPVTSGI